MSSQPSRRAAIRQLALGGLAAGLGPWPAWAQPPGRRPQDRLAGQSFDLTIGRTAVDVTGRPRTAVTVNGSLPGPLLQWREGDDVRLRVSNTLDEETSIHWHGLLLPAAMDGVPGLSFNGIAPGAAYDYRFRVRQSGTYWYHGHSGVQEQLGVYGPIVIAPDGPDPIVADREHVVVLSDWTDEDPRGVLRRLKKQSDYYNRNRRTLETLFADARRDGWAATLEDRRMWAGMRMSAADLADVTGATYTYLVNGQSPTGNWTGLFTPGERVRLRVINASAMTYFDVRIPGLTLTVVAADGLPVRPVAVDEFRIAVAETFDVVVEPSGREAFTLFAQAMDRTGFAAATLATRVGLRAPVPALDPRPVLSMADMGHAMPASADAADPHAGHVMAAESDAPDPHAGHVMPAAPAAPDDPHAGHVMPAAPDTPDPHAGHHMGGSAGLAHPESERGNPLVDMQATAPVSKLDDPGIGLRGNGRRVLAYADLASAFSDPDGREPSRTIEIHLTGHMERFAWSFDGVPFSKAEPIRLTYGERVRIVLVNDTMMTHPIHLHGLWSDLEDDAGRFLVRKHTIDMPPGSRRSYRVTADALGRWAYHCHLLFHMETGMMRAVHVDLEPHS
ncbi:MAG: copper resistance system multicopper oxidase [Vicinamibacterales bacterium]